MQISPKVVKKSWIFAIPILIDVNESSYEIFSEAVVKVHADSRPNNKNDCVLQGIFVRFCQISSKSHYFRHSNVLSSFRQFFVKNEIPWSLINSYSVSVVQVG